MLSQATVIIMNTDEIYMHRCIELARLSAGSVAPNPMVGAVLVYKNVIIGEGYHRQYGQPHAEVNCIRDATLRYTNGKQVDSPEFEQMLQKSTLYVSLEPCAHHGKTPPCADLIIEKKIPVVVVGCRDPFPQVDGKGIEKLLAAGVLVKTGVLQQECMDLNKRFFTQHILHRPYIVLKWAQSNNRKIAAAQKRTVISNDISNRLVHKWRSEESSILVGTTTALIDNPSLTTRLWKGKNPVRLVLDKHLQLPGTLAVFNEDAKTIVFNYIKDEEKGNITYARIDKDNSIVKEIIHAVFQFNIQSILIEGGARLLQSFIDEGMWDEARVITAAELEMDAGLDAPVLTSAEATGKKTLGRDQIQFYKPVRQIMFR